jgi:enoyl-CoA hydratase/carnithine racemase
MTNELVTEFKLTWYDSPRAGRLALVTMDNGEDYRKPNTLGEGAIASLNAVLDEVEAAGAGGAGGSDPRSECKGLLLTGKPFIFAVGADINMFEGVTPELVLQGTEVGQAAFRRLAGSTRPARKLRIVPLTPFISGDP